MEIHNVSNINKTLGFYDKSGGYQGRTDVLERLRLKVKMLKSNMSCKEVLRILKMCFIIYFFICPV